MKQRWFQLMKMAASRASLRLAIGSARWVLTVRWRFADAPEPLPAVQPVAKPSVEPSISPDEVRLRVWSSLRRKVAAPAEPAPTAPPLETKRAGESRLAADLARFRSGFTARKGALA